MNKVNAGVAVVTGGGSGIGASICQKLHKRGYSVVIGDVNPDGAATIANAIGGEAHVLDVTSPTSCRDFAQEVLNRYQQIDVWVSNAGVSRMIPFLDIEEVDYDKTLDVNLKGVFFASQAAARVMVPCGKGSIINIASMAGKQGRVPFLSDYVASKFGVVGLTQAMAYELAPFGIRVNSVCPGYVATPMQERELTWEASLREMSTEDITRLWIDDTPMGRLSQPEDVALVVAFLAGSDSQFLTGESIAVNGGAFMD